MYSSVKVISVKDDLTVLVGCDTQACQGCKAEMFCNNKNHNSYLALNDRKLSVKAGDWVELYLPPGKTILSTVMVFALPLVLFPIGFILASKLSSLSETGCAFVGLACMSFAFLIAYYVSSKNKKALMPKIIKIL